MADPGKPPWQPISQLPTLIAHIQRGVQFAAEQLATLQGAREHPYVLDDMTVARVTAAFTQTRTELVSLLAEQGRRWQSLDLRTALRREVERFVDLVGQELDLVDQVLVVAKELTDATTQRMLASTGLELDLEALTPRRR